jgi:flagellar basal-body rod modification protein FlgD
MAITSTAGLLGQYEESLKAQSGTDRVATDKDTFLKLLVAQLSNQDPLNPVEDKEFIAQLAQFTSVEELQKISSGVEELNGNYIKQQVTTAASFMGMRISAKGDMVSLTDSSSPSSFIYPNFPREAASATINVYATDGDGNPTSLVYSESLGSMSEGTHEHQWPGYTSNGSRAPQGTYVVTYSAVDADGKSMLVDTSSIGVVTGVQVSEDGNHWLALGDGRKVRLNDIDMMANYVPAGSDGEEEAAE